MPYQPYLGPVAALIAGIWSPRIWLSILLIPLLRVRVSGAGLNLVKEVPSNKLGQLHAKE